MFITFILDSNSNTVNLARIASNRTFTHMCLKNTHLKTDSVTKEVYYLYIEGLYVDESINCVNTKATIPMYKGLQKRDIKLNPVGVLKPSYEYTIFNQDGTKTSDAVIIDLLFEIE